MVEVKELKPGVKLIYFKVDSLHGFHVGVSYYFGLEVDKVLKTKIKTKEGREFKIQNGKIHELYYMNEREEIIVKVKEYYKEEFIETGGIKSMPRLKVVALKELLKELFG